MPDLWHLQAESKCPFPLAMLTDRSIGDMILAMGALQILAEKYEQIIVTSNIPELLTPMAPKNANFHLGWMPYHSQCEVFNISVGSSMNPRYGHPIKQILDHIGVESPCAIPQPRWNERKQRAWFDNGWHVEQIAYPEYDFLLHMNTDDKERLWPFQQWGYLIGALLKEYPGCSIGILGSDIRPPWNHHNPDPRPFDEGGYHGMDWNCAPRNAKSENMAQPGVEYVYNQSFELVASLVKRARKAVITIDSAVSRIAHAVQCKNHVLLAPDTYPLEWSAHPLCFDYYGNPKTWAVNGLMSVVGFAVEQWEGERYGMPEKRHVDAKALWQLRALLSRWSEWPLHQNGGFTFKYTGGFGVIGSEVPLTGLPTAIAQKLKETAQKSGLFEEATFVAA